MFLRFILELRHALQLSDGTDGIEHPGKLDVFRNLRLNKQRRLGRIHPARYNIRNDLQRTSA